MGERFDARFQMVTCSNCDKHFRCTPRSDYYNGTNAEDGVCEPCLLAGHKGANPPKPGSVSPLLQDLIDAGIAVVPDA